MIKNIKGNILDANEDIICHQVNCQKVMNADLAKQIRNKYPNVYKEYVDLINWAKEEYKRGYSKKESLLGSIQFVECSDGKIVANLFGQDRYGRDKQYTDYEALEKCLYSLYESVTWENNKLKGKSIAIPYGIGCGLGGGDWNTVYGIIEKIFSDYDVSIYKLK